MLVNTLPYSLIAIRASPKVAANNRSSESLVNPQYQVERHSPRSIWLIVPGTVSSSVPPGFRIRCSVRIAAGTS